MTAVEKAILSAICYFDVFDYPLTLMEIWKWLFFQEGAQKTTLAEVEEILQSSKLLGEKLETKNGFYFLRGREEIVNRRLERYRLAEDKYERAVRIIKYLRWMPFVKIIAICNTLAYSNSRREGDIDLFIITSPRRVWQARWWVTGFLKLFNLRPTLQKTQDTFCASFFIDKNNLNLEIFKVADDIYLPYWIVQLYPVYDEGLYNDFETQNAWVRKKIPNWIPASTVPRRTVAPAGWLKSVYTGFFTLLPESFFKKQQMHIMPEKLREAANKDTRVIINDGVLKFHDNDRRRLYYESWKKRLNQAYGQ
ncbi:MAG: hypothetical protein WCV50_04450 [Patescibacteria group bacterium]|jgi:hypothetical protein